MVLINVKVIAGVFSDDEKKRMVTRLTDAMVDIEGESLRAVTWVVIEEVRSGDWAIGGQPLATENARALGGRR
jgi:4-oxalocrotonate tautomerase